MRLIRLLEQVPIKNFNYRTSTGQKVQNSGIPWDDASGKKTQVLVKRKARSVL